MRRRIITKPNPGVASHEWLQGSPPPLPPRRVSSPWQTDKIMTELQHDLSQDSGISPSPLLYTGSISSSRTPMPEGYDTFHSNYSGMSSLDTLPPPLPPKPKKPTQQYYRGHCTQIARDKLATSDVPQTALHIPVNRVQGDRHTTQENFRVYNRDSTQRAPVIGSVKKSVLQRRHSESEISSFPKSAQLKSANDDSVPGFSNKKRRQHFRKALSELESTVTALHQDYSLLDRAERRDLPTRHQELIANSKSSELETQCLTPRDVHRPKTPSNRRSAIFNKTTDDVVYRLSYRTSETRSPISKSDFLYRSYLDLPGQQPEDYTTNSEGQEPDIELDDLNRRRLRDADVTPQRRYSKQEESHQFGIPREKIVTTPKDYLKAIPEFNRYKSTFNQMRHPDVVKDDMAFRALRKDSNATCPQRLGIPSENMAPSVPGCWHHKMKAREGLQEKEESGPVVFYPKKDHKLLECMSSNFKQVIRKHSASANGGTIQDLIDVQKVQEAEKSKKEVKIDKEGERTMYNLLYNPETQEEKSEPEQGTLIVHHCKLEQRLVGTDGSLFSAKTTESLDSLKVNKKCDPLFKFHRKQSGPLLHPNTKQVYIAVIANLQAHLHSIIVIALLLFVLVSLKTPS